jgi:DNA-binding Lrp family transcriptional regulator
VFVQICLERQVVEALERFEEMILGGPEVRECDLITGDADGRYSR